MILGFIFDVCIKIRTDSIITGWITHNPNNVIIIKPVKCLAVVLSVLKVNFLLAKKLNINATDVDIKLLTMFGRPNSTKINRIEKSMAVLIAPTDPNLIFSA